MENNFDQLFKEKINSKSYPYSAKAWKSFSKKMGWGSGLGSAQVIVITTLASLIIAAGGYFLYHQLRSDRLPATSCETPTQPASITDTMHTSNAIDTIHTQEIDNATVETSEQPKQNTAPRNSNVAASQPVSSTATDTVSSVKNNKTYILRPKNPRRILEINTDTIKSND